MGIRCRWWAVVVASVAIGASCASEGGTPAGDADDVDAGPVLARVVLQSEDMGDAWTEVDAQPTDGESTAAVADCFGIEDPDVDALQVTSRFETTPLNTTKLSSQAGPSAEPESQGRLLTGFSEPAVRECVADVIEEAIVSGITVDGGGEPKPVEVLDRTAEEVVPVIDEAAAGGMRVRFSVALDGPGGPALAYTWTVVVASPGQLGVAIETTSLGDGVPLDQLEGYLGLMVQRARERS